MGVHNELIKLSIASVWDTHRIKIEQLPVFILLQDIDL